MKDRAATRTSRRRHRSKRWKSLFARVVEREHERKTSANAAGYPFDCLTADLSSDQVLHGLHDRSTWGSGPWDGEPDRVMFRAAHPPHYRCQLERNWRGSWCGYVAVPKGHPAWGQDSAVLRRSGIHAHGGINWEGRGIDDSWLFGFDACHGYDISPTDPLGLREPSRELGIFYRELAFVRAETESLARQLASFTAESLPS